MKALINVYNESQFISVCLESLKDCMDEIVIADGAYQMYFDEFKKDYPQAKPWSTDGTLEIIHALKDMPTVRLIRCTKPWLNQTVKRNALINAVAEGEWFIIIDADEMLTGNVYKGLKEIVESGSVAGRAPLLNAGADVGRLNYFWHPRVFMKMEGMHYERTHWQLRDRHDRIIENTYPVWWTQDFVIIHFKLFKSPNRLVPHQAYMDKFGRRGWVEPLVEEVKNEQFK